MLHVTEYPEGRLRSWFNLVAQRSHKVLQDVGLIPDSLLPSCKMDALTLQDCMHRIIEKRENVPPSTLDKKSWASSREAMFGHVLSHSGPVGFEMPSADWLRSSLGANP